MIEASLGALIGLLTLVVLVALLLGAVVLRIVRKKDAEDELFGVRGLDNSKRLNLPPLLSTETNPVLKTAIQPSSLRRSFRSGVFGGLFRRGDNPDIVIDSPPHDVNGDYVGKINFGLSFDKQAQTLAVHVIQAADLPVKDITGSSDPYVRICLLPDLNVVKVTRVHRRNLAPAFNQTVVFTALNMEAMLRHYTMHEMLHGHHHDSTCVGNMRRNDEYRTHHRSPHHSGGSHHHSAHRSRSVFLRHMTEEGEGCSPSLVKVRRQYLLSRPPGHTMKKLQDMTLCMQMMDYDRFTRDDPIGEILLPLKSVKFDNCPVYWKNLQKPTVHKEPKGELMLSLCYLPQSNKVTCVVVKAKDLPPKDVTGFADPYVKLWLLQEGTKIEKKKTTVKSQTLTPIYNESFAFAISPDKMEDIQLVASVMDYDLIKSNDDIGFVVLGTKGSETGKKHWQEMMSRPGYPIGMWHPLQPKW